MARSSSKSRNACRKPESVDFRYPEGNVAPWLTTFAPTLDQFLLEEGQRPMIGSAVARVRRKLPSELPYSAKEFARLNSQMAAPFHRQRQAGNGGGPEVVSGAVSGPPHRCDYLPAASRARESVTAQKLRIRKVVCQSGNSDSMLP
jgi:hypothetical protein